MKEIIFLPYSEDGNSFVRKPYNHNKKWFRPPQPANQAANNPDLVTAISELNDMLRRQHVKQLEIQREMATSLRQIAVNLAECTEKKRGKGDAAKGNANVEAEKKEKNENGVVEQQPQ